MIFYPKNFFRFFPLKLFSSQEPLGILNISQEILDIIRSRVVPYFVAPRHSA
jgi:hypothetical protein